MADCLRIKITSGKIHEESCGIAQNQDQNDKNYHSGNLASNEYTQNKAIIPNIQSLLALNDYEFIQEAYRRILLREPDDSGRYYYTQRLKEGTLRTQILGQLSRSGETEIANQLYKKIRINYRLMTVRQWPLIGWVAEILSAFSNFQLREFLVGDEEMFVERAYVSVLGRQPDPEGRLHYTSLVEKGFSRIQVLADLKLSNEGKKAVSKVSGLLIIARLMYFKRLPMIKQICYIISTPRVVSEILRHVHKTESAILRLEKARDSDLETVTLSLKTGLNLISDLSLKLNNHEILLDKSFEYSQDKLKEYDEKNSKFFDSLIGKLQYINQISIDIQQKQQSEIVSLFNCYSNVINQSLQNFEESIRNPMLARFAHADKSQSELQGQIKQYSLSLNAFVTSELFKFNDIISKKIGASFLSIVERLSETRNEIINLKFSLGDLIGKSEKIIIKRTSIESNLLLGKNSEYLEFIKNIISDFDFRFENIRKEFLLSRNTNSENITKEIERLFCLINQDKIETVNRIQELANGLESTISRVEAELPVQLRNAVLPLNASLSQAIDNTRTEIDELSPKINRIENYSMNAARRFAIRCGSDSLLVRTVVGFILCPESDYSLIALLIETGDLEPGTRQLIERLLVMDDTFIDIGANIGMHTLAAARAMSGHGKVIAFEPHPQTCNLLTRSIWMNGFSSMVQIYNVAATAKSEKRSLNIGLTCGHHSLFPLDTANALDKNAIVVDSVAIDDILKSVEVVSLIKIDAEGAELEILKGAASILKRNTNIGIIAEFSGSYLRRTGIDIIVWLNEFTLLGFNYLAINEDTGSLREISVEELYKINSVNLFFARPQSPLWQKAEVTK
jgi:FkbM family methyltransferase